MGCAMPKGESQGAKVACCFVSYYFNSSELKSRGTVSTVTFEVRDDCRPYKFETRLVHPSREAAGRCVCVKFTFVP